MSSTQEHLSSPCVNSYANAGLTITPSSHPFSCRAIEARRLFGRDQNEAFRNKLRVIRRTKIDRTILPLHGLEAQGVSTVIFEVPENHSHDSFLPQNDHRTCT